MKRKLIWVAICVLLLLSMILASCAQATSSTTTPTTTTAISTVPSQTPGSTTPSSSAGVTTTPPPTTTTVAQTKWWDKFGTPQYGGTITFATGALTAVNFDLYNFAGAENDLWYEALFEPSWTLDRQVWPMTGMFYPDQYIGGNLAQSWDMTDPTTITVHLQQGVHWQNKPPVNGREFVASDVQAHYDRLMGTGSGYTQPDPMYGGLVGNLIKVTATDKYTVVFKFKQPSDLNLQTIADRVALNEMDAPEWVALGGGPSTSSASAGGGSTTAASPLTDWKTVVGTGPWMLTDFVAGSFFTFSKNPDYWGHDPRFPQNQVPYADTLKMLVIPDASTRLAALRTGQIDTLNNGADGGLTWQDAQQLNKSTPEIQQQKIPGNASGVGLRVDVKPFTDIRVREALDMAIDRAAIAKSYYGGTSDVNPVGMVTSTYKGYAYPYSDWPQSLKDQYTYNPTKAKQLLADAGYPDGFKTDVVTKNDNATLQLLQIFQSYFSAIGVNMQITPMDPAAYQAFTRAGKQDQMSSQGLAFTQPLTFIADMYYSKGGGDAVFYGLNNAPDTTYDTLHDQFLTATDPTKAMEIFQNMDKECIEQHWTIAGPESYKFNIWQPYLKGYSGETLMWGQGITLSRLWTTKQ